MLQEISLPLRLQQKTLGHEHILLGGKLDTMGLSAVFGHHMTRSDLRSHCKGKPDGISN